MGKFRLTERKKLLIYKVLLFIFAFVLAFAPTTVSRSMEVNSRVVVEMLGLDSGEEGITVTAQYATPTETENATTKDKVTVEAQSLTQAVEALSTALGRRAELGQCSVVVVGSDFDVEKLGTLMTATDVTADVYLVAAKEKASDLVGELTDFMKKSGVTDADFIAYSAKKAHIATVTLLNFLSNRASASATAFMPVVEMRTREESDDQTGGGSDASNGGSGGSNGGNRQGGESGKGGGEEPPVGMKIEQLALYNEKGRVGLLKQLSARGVAWVSSPIEKSIVVADVEYDGRIIKNVSGRLCKKCVAVRVDPVAGRARVELKAHIVPNGDKFNEIDSERSSAVTAAVKAGFEREIKGELWQAYSDAAALDCDPFFIGREFYRVAPDYYDEVYALGAVTVDFDVDVVLK